MRRARGPVVLAKKDLKDFRKQQWLRQDRKCAVTGLPLHFQDSVVDHQHKKKKEIAGEDGKGLVRGVIHKNINVLEGKILGAFKRYGLSKVAPLSAILRGLADYLENPPVTSLIHPKSIPKVKKKKLWLRDIVRVEKYWEQMYPKRKLKFPALIKKGKKSFHYETKLWTEHIKKANGLAKLDTKNRKKKK